MVTFFGAQVHLRNVSIKVTHRVKVKVKVMRYYHTSIGLLLQQWLIQTYGD